MGVGVGIGSEMMGVGVGGTDIKISAEDVLGEGRLSQVKTAWFFISVSCSTEPFTWVL